MTQNLIKSHHDRGAMYTASSKQFYYLSIQMIFGCIKTVNEYLIQHQNILTVFNVGIIGINNHI